MGGLETKFSFYLQSQLNHNHRDNLSPQFEEVVVVNLSCPALFALAHRMCEAKTNCPIHTMFFSLEFNNDGHQQI